MQELLEKAWFEKYRAKDIDEYIFNSEKLEKFAKEAYEKEFIPGNVLFYGKPGTGKTNLAQILIKRIIKDKNDLFIIKERSVKEIDKIKIWIQKKAIKSKQKIVYCEEADRLAQSRQAVAELKTITEKYIPNTIFLFITNYISKLDPALITRFTLKFEFNTLPVDKVFEKIKQILINENIEFDENELYTYIKSNISRGLRELINSIQLMSLDGKFKVDKKVILNSINEEKVINLFTNLVNTLTTINNRMLVEQLMFTSNILNFKEFASYYSELVSILQNDKLLNYNYIYERLLENIEFVPFYKKILEYYESNDMKKYKHLHLIALFYELVKIWREFLG